jgi:hypothetical protein
MRERVRTFLPAPQETPMPDGDPCVRFACSVLLNSEAACACWIDDGGRSKSKKLAGNRQSVAMRGLIIALLPLLLTGCEKDRLDAEVRRLCAKDGGVKVYETVKLPPEKFDNYGHIKITFEKYSKESDEYYYTWDVFYLKKQKSSTDSELWRSNHKIIRRSDKKILGESILYVRRGGDIIAGPFGPTTFGCGDIIKSPDLERSIFLKGK